MNIQNLIIYKFSTLYFILKELEDKLNLNVFEVLTEEELNSKIKNFKNYIIITDKKILNLNNQFVLENFPIKINILIEKLNIEYLKQKFNDQAKVIIKNYTINLNSREMLLNSLKLKLTEKEVNTIVHLSKNQYPTTIQELQTTVWGYQSNIETHTVETHIYRLRKKIFRAFQDKNFIISKKKGYQISSE